MARVLFISHPEVVVEPNVPVPEWGLSDQGRMRMAAFAGSSRLEAVSAIWSSEERKAIEAADILAEALGLQTRRHAPLHENDRSATGYLPPDKFEAAADRFFAAPEESILGWERAVDAQARIVAAVASCLARSSPGDVVIVAHGGVGTLLLCHLLGRPIDRALDQPSQGHVFAFSRHALSTAQDALSSSRNVGLVSDRWTRLEHWSAGGLTDVPGSDVGAATR